MNIASILNFLTRLNSNNNKEWFDQNRKEYEQIKLDLKKFAAEMIAHIAPIDEHIADLEPKDCLFRINRDVRFSNNKAPYKNNIGFALSRGGKKSIYGGFYFHIQPGNESYVAGGLYVPEPLILKKIRAEIDYNAKEIEQILSDKKFKKYFKNLTGDKLARPPKGFNADHPQIELLKQKSFLGIRTISDNELTEINIENYLIETYAALLPLNNYFNKAIDFQE